MKILGISGSLRKDSYNTRLLRAADGLLGDEATLQVFDLGEIPLYDGDLDGASKPASVKALLNAIATTDVMLIAPRSTPTPGWRTRRHPDGAKVRVGE